jgi:carbon-monoxide dehydrogenase large subunit
MNEMQTRFGSGQAVSRMEDDALLKGQGLYADDTGANAAHLVFVRSPYPHAHLRGVDASAARAMPGVRLVVTGDELHQQGIKPLPRPMNFTRADGSALNSTDRRLLAHGRVRYVGEPVAAVVADTLEQAKDAAEAVIVDYDPLPSVTSVPAALATDAPRLADGPDNIVAETRYGSVADAAAQFAQAAHVVRLDINNQRLAAFCIEPRSVLGDWQEERLVIRISSQMPTGIRTTVCDLLGLPTEQVRVLVGDVGGGFGMKTGPYPEDIVVAHCAHTLKSAVKWVADRGEEFLSSAHGRDVQSKAELALDASGRILALRVHGQANVGAYPTMTGVAIQCLIGPWVQTSVYDIPLIDFHFQAVMTNTATTGAYRGAGRPEAIYIMERLMDEAARQMGMDRIALRRRNFIQPHQFPYKNPMGQVYDVGAFEQVMDGGLTLADWAGFEARAQASAKQGLWRGLGVATFLEWTGGNALEENVNVRILDDGVIEVFSAVNQMGQGIATSLAQLVVDVFQVPIHQVRVVLGDTDRGNGFGSAGSRSLFTGGSAMHVGAGEALDKARELAAQDLEVSGSDLVYEAGQFSVKGTDLKRSLAELAAKQPQRRIEVNSKTAAKGPTWPNGCHVCEVEVDPATGVIQVAAYASMNDVGRVVNPTIVRGQLDGGAVQGLGQALLEAIQYDPDSGQLLTGSLMDYAVPHADIAQSMFLTEMDERTPSTNNVLGVKGVGELGTIGATPAVVNAVADALARNGHAAAAPGLQMPLTPERVWRAIQSH